MKENGDQLPRVQLYTFKLLVLINVKIPKCPGKNCPQFEFTIINKLSL